MGALHEQAWPGLPAHDHDPALLPLSMLLVDGGRVLAMLDILSKEISHQGQSYRASGLSTVVTDPANRRKGYGTQLVRAARGWMQVGGGDLALFTCDRPLQAFYEHAGWSVLPGSVLIGGTREHPFPSDQLDKVVMAAFFSDRAKEHAPSFRQQRIELYPGEIDKLW